ncbi:hypothetical protein HYY74_01830 [Candidatus Woesearchaeota archaeon]|nr:hypothetical protein [Candidatus Woesearchaeota archaeon]
MARVLSRMDYVELYAKALRQDNRHFAQQKMLIESQMKSSSQLFGRMFGGPDFKEKAREYLRKVGLI